MSKLWGAVQSGADPIGGVLPMDTESSDVKLRSVSETKVARCRVKPGMTIWPFFFVSSITVTTKPTTPRQFLGRRPAANSAGESARQPNFTEGWPVRRSAA